MFLKLFDSFSGRSTLIEEKARLEAFLSAVPGDYCGWSPDGSVAYSQGFCKLLKLESISSIFDIQNALQHADGTSLEGLFNRLRQEGLSFLITATSKDEQNIFKISGNKGATIDGSDHFNVLWIEDITRETKAQKKSTQELQDKQTLYEQMKVSLDTFPWPLWMRNDRQELKWVNLSYADMLDSKINDILDQQKEIIPSSRRKKKGDTTESALGPSLAQKALETGDAQEAKTHIIDHGKRLLMRVYEAPLTKHGFTVGFAEDITPQEDLENDLKRYRATNEELLEQLRTAIGIYGPDHRLEFYNSAFSQLWGLEEQWLNNKPKLGDVMEKLREARRLPEQADFRRFKQSWMDMFTGLIDPHEDMLYLPDGSALRMLVVAQSTGGLMMTFEDVTSRLELESSYNTLIAVQRETLDNLGEGIAVYAGDGRLRLCNPAFGRLWGLNPEDLENAPHINTLVEKKKKFFAPQTWPEKREELISKGLDRIMHEGRMRLNNGIHMDYMTVPLPDGGVLITYIDVTDTLRVENALREKNAALETAEQLKLDFLANVSYQLRTPLNAIIGFNDILNQEFFGTLNERQKSYTRDIAASGERLVNLIDDILDLSTIEAGYLVMEKAPMKVKNVIGGLADLVCEWARKDKIEVDIRCATNVGSIQADERRIKQAIINLVRNSISFTPNGGKITLGAKRRKDGVEIYVQDTGIGISREHHIRIFEPFEKANSGYSDAEEPQKQIKDRRSGAGLGLSLVKNIVELHDGSLNLESEPNAGTKVSMFFPFTNKENIKSEAVKIKAPLKLEELKKKET